MTPRKNPPLPVRDRCQSMAVNHVRKFVEDELIIEPKAFLRLGALGKVYADWVEFHGVINRRISANELLLRLERDYGLTSGTIYINTGGDDEGTLYGLRGARLRDPALNARRRSGKGYFARPAKSWEGVIPDVAERLENRSETTDDEGDDE